MVRFRGVATAVISVFAGGFVGSKAFGYDNNWLNLRHLEARLPLDNRLEEIEKYGLPSESNVIEKQNLVIGYDNSRRSAAWVLGHINKDLLNAKNADRNKSRYKEDTLIPRAFRATKIDFRSLGQDWGKGHLSPAHNHTALQEWMNETFHLSNIIVQNKDMNQNAWKKLEEYVRNLAFRYDNVYICTGPLYSPRENQDLKVVGEHSIPIPTHLFKVVVCEQESKFELLSFRMENAAVDSNLAVEKFFFPVEGIEKESRLTFFNKIPRDTFKKINNEETQGNDRRAERSLAVETSRS